MLSASRRLLIDTMATGITDKAMVGRGYFVLFGAACLAVVVLTHVAETFGIFRSMGWGQPNSAGHYLDLASAILGCTLLQIGLIASFIARRKNSN